MVSSFLNFEREIQQEFESALRQMPDCPRWSSERNYRMPKGGDVDLIVRKDDHNYALVEIKAGTYNPSLFRAAIISTRQKAYTLNSPYFFIVARDKFAFFRADGHKLHEEDRLITQQDIIDILREIHADEFNHIEWERNVEDIIEYVNQIEDEQFDAKKENISQVLSLIKAENGYTIDKSALKVTINPELEERLYKSLLGTYNKDKVCRFTSMSSLFRSINEGKQSMCSIVAMNDKSETSYVSDYISRKNPDMLKAVNSGPNDWNNSYITSCCDEDRELNFTMFRLYADDARGVSLLYKVDDLEQYPGFILSPVSYQRKDNTHPELDIIINLLQISIGGYTVVLPSLSTWQHFFKPKEYEIEKEIRLMYRQSAKDDGNIDSVESKWILNEEFNIIAPLILFDIQEQGNKYPLILNAVNLGAKMKEAVINRQQLEYILKKKKIKNHSNVNVNLSDVNHYR